MKPVAPTLSNNLLNLSLPSFSNNAGSPHRLISIKQNKQTLLLCSSSIAYVRSEHVYVEIYFGGSRRMLHRDSLAGLVRKLPEHEFVQVHRSYVVNLKWVSGWRSDALFIGETAIPISRNRRQEVMDRLHSL